MLGGGRVRGRASVDVMESGNQSMVKSKLSAGVGRRRGGGQPLAELGQ